MEKKVYCKICGSLMEYDEDIGEGHWYCEECDEEVFEAWVDEYIEEERTRMAVCENCGKKFNFDDAAAEFEQAHHGLRYSDLEGKYCADCGIKFFDEYFKEHGE